MTSISSCFCYSKSALCYSYWHSCVVLSMPRPLLNWCTLPIHKSWRIPAATQPGILSYCLCWSQLPACLAVLHSLLFSGSSRVKYILASCYLENAFYIRAGLGLPIPCIVGCLFKKVSFENKSYRNTVIMGSENLYLFQTLHIPSV